MPRPAPNALSARGPDAQPGRLAQHGGERLVHPSEVGGLAHHAVGQPHLTGHGDPDPDDAHPALAGEHPGDPGRGEGDGLADTAGRGGLDADALQHAAAEADQADDHGVHLGVDRDRGDAVRDAHERARPPPAGTAPRSGGGSGRLVHLHQPQPGQLAHQIADGGAVETGQTGEVAARERALPVHEPEHGRQIAPAQGVRRAAGGVAHGAELGGRRHDPTITPVTRIPVAPPAAPEQGAPPSTRVSPPCGRARR
jgi:hypothetical protein